MDDITEMDKSDHAGSCTKCLTQKQRFSLVPKNVKRLMKTLFY